MYVVHILNFPAPISTEFPCSKDKKSRNLKKYLVVLYPIYIHSQTMISIIPKKSQLKLY